MWSKNMKAAVLETPGLFAVKEVPIPELESDEVLVRVAACGICHTDLHYIEHGVPTAKTPPIILGHEASGLIDAKGDRVRDFNIGDRVLLPAVLTCGRCRLCRSGRENICESMKMPGNHLDGAYAEFVKAPSRDLFRVPKNLSLQ